MKVNKQKSSEAALAKAQQERDDARGYAVKLRIEHAAELDKLRSLWDADAAQLAKAKESLKKIRDVQFPEWEAQTAVDYCRNTAKAALSS